MALNDSEIKVLEILWKYGDIPASQLYKLLEEKIGWNRTTSYTIIKRCIMKGLIIKIEPHYICRAAITKKEVQQDELSNLIHRFFDGSPAKLMRAFIDENNLTEEDINELENIVKKMK